jgi:hypothetical protein
LTGFSDKIVKQFVLLLLFGASAASAENQGVQKTITSSENFAQVVASFCTAFIYNEVKTHMDQ